MADLYWRGGSGNWSDTAHWDTTDGGAGPHAAPTSSDNANFTSLSNATSYTVTLTGAAVCANLVVGDPLTGTVAFTTDTTYGRTLTLSGNVTANGTSGLSWTGNSAATHGLIKSDTVGTPRTITAAAVSLTDVDFSDITFANSTAPGTPFTGTRLGDAKGNSGDITFTTPANKYYVGNTANWNNTVWALTSGGAADANNFPLPQDTAVFDANSFSANSQTVTVNGAFRLPSIDFSGMTNRTGITFAASSDFNVYGDWKQTTATGFAVSLGAGTTAHFVGRITQTVTPAGVAWTSGRVEINSPGGTVAVSGSAWTGLSFLTLTAGTFNMGGNGVTTTYFASSNSNTRSITSGGATLTLNGGAATPLWTTATSSGLTLNDPLQLDCTNASGGGRQISNGATTAANTPSVKISAGSDAINLSGSANLKNFDCTGFSGTLSLGNATLTLFGNFDAGSATSMTTNFGSLVFGATTGTQTVKSNGSITFNTGVSVNAPGATVQLVDNLTLGNTRTFTHTAGIIDLNTKTLSPGRFSTSGSTARTIKDSAGTGKIATTDTTAATVFDATTTTNLTVDRTNAWTIEIGGNTTNIRTANLGSGKSWPALTFTNTTANGELDLVCSSTTTVLKALAYTGGTAQTIKRTAGTTITVEDDNGFPSGTAGNVITIGSITAASHTWAKSGGGVVGCDYLSISRSTATPGTTWYAGPLAHSTDGGNNSGWTFTAAPAHYTLTVAYGAFTLTGENAGLLAARTLPAGQGAFALTGEPAGLTAARKLSVANGSFTLTGENAGLYYGHRFTAGQGAFTLTGENAGLYHGRLLTAGLGAFTLTGEDVAFSRTYNFPAGQGSFTLTGESIGLRAARLISPGTGYFFLNRLMHHDPSKPLSAHGAGTGLTPHAAGSSIKRHV